MAWVRLDDSLEDDPRIAAVGTFGTGVLTLALCYSNRNLTDGWIPEPVFRRFLRDSTHEAAEEARAALLQANVFSESARDGGPGLQIHESYVLLQPTRDEVLKQRKGRSLQKAVAGRLGGVASGEARRKQRRSTSEAEVIHGGSTSEAPIPIPIPIPDEEKAGAAPRPPDIPAENVSVITRLAHDSIDVLGVSDRSDLRADLKDRCAELHIAYDSEAVEKAIESAIHQRRAELRRVKSA